VLQMQPDQKTFSRERTFDKAMAAIRHCVVEAQRLVGAAKLRAVRTASASCSYGWESLESFVK